MKKFLSIFILFLLFSSNSYSDPIPYTDDWDLLDKTIKSKLYFKNSGYQIELELKNNQLVFTSNKKSKNIYQLKNNKFDIYLISKNNEPLIYIFNKTLKKLLIGNIDNTEIKFVSQSWDFGILEAIIDECQKIETSLGYKHDKNYMLSRFKYSNRPKDMQCFVLMYGGRCKLVFNPNTNEYEYNDKMVLTDEFKYEGDIDEISYLLGNQYGTTCKFYNKLSI